jgi:peptide methionine sulfoxide reductase msrA/msrB
MKAFFAAIAVLAFAGASLMTQQNDKKTVYNKLTPQEERVIIYKEKELPFTGKYLNNKEAGTYVCKRCDAPLYRSSDKFTSPQANCGWPAFDDEIKGAVKRIPDADGIRTEIVCANCGAPLGHVFLGESLTPKNTRHCVNSISIVFIPAAKGQSDKKKPNTNTNDPNRTKNGEKTQIQKAYFAGSCFWGVDYWLRKEKGVTAVNSGFMGGWTKNPTYEQVCTGKTGHAETVEVVYDPNKVSYEALAKLFFEIHDPTQRNRQGPDIGSQYRSVVFYTDDPQKEIADKLITELRKKGLDVATTVEQAGPFWKADEHHQNYYGKNGKQPYCHIFTKRF